MPKKVPSSFHISKILLFPLILITFISLAFNFFLFRTLSELSRVVEVADGDTFQLASGKRVRLMGVDAPEYNRCGGSEAKSRLSELILGKKVTLKEETSESFGRSLALVYSRNQLINEIILREGWGRTDYRRNSKRQILTSAYQLARRNKLGIFSTLCRDEDFTPEKCNIKGNIDKATYDRFYHYPGCPHYDEVVIEKDTGEGYFCSEEEAVSAGFTQASGCP